MRKILLILLVMLLLFPSGASALSAQSAILMDVDSGRVLSEENAYQRRGMASTTKIMTAIVAIENGNLTDEVTVSNTAANVEGSSMWLKAGEKIPLESLLYGLMLNSGNDAATAIAEHVGGSIEGFAEMMNSKAKQLGLKDTSFTNPHGLDNDNHYTTAYDLAQIARYALKNPTFAEIVSTKAKVVSSEDDSFKRSLRNHNKMLTLYDNADGVKTGFTKKCGRCLVSSATRDGMQLVAVTLNAPDDWNDHTELLNFGFNKFHNKLFLKEKSHIKTVRVENGLGENIALIAKNQLSTVVTDTEEQGVRIEYEVPDTIQAPVIKDQPYGKANLYINDTLLASVDAVAQYGVAEKYTTHYLDILHYLFLELLSSFLTHV